MSAKVLLSLLLAALMLCPPRAATASPRVSLQSPTACPPLPPPGGVTVVVADESGLRARAYDAPPNVTILVAAGTYHMADFVHIVHDGVTLRGETGDRDDVILDFGGMVGGHFGILVDGDDVTIADLTIRNAQDHGVSIQGVDRPTLYNLHIQDIGDQLVKVNPLGDGSEDGLLACSRLEYTTSAPDSYTNGISAHNARRWTVRDNEWYRIRTNDGTPVPAILFWSGSADTIVERNLLVDCAQGISFGNSAHGPGDHLRGIVRNNIVYVGSGVAHDVAIEMVHAQGWLVAHNTVYWSDAPPGLTWSVEARFPDTYGTFAYNLTNRAIWADRDGAAGLSTGNVTAAQANWFVDAAAGDMHLRSTATAAIDQALPLAQVADDFDGDGRPIGGAPDVGADEYGVTPPPPVTDLRVVSGTAGGGMLTVTLRWTPPAGAVSGALRYDEQPITLATWEGAHLLAAALPGGTGTHEASLPWSGGTVYFAFRSENEGGLSGVSNPAFWPHHDLFLPAVCRED